MPNALLTTEEVARILGLSPFTVRRLLREGELPGKKVGKRQWRILRADLDEYVSTPSSSAMPPQTRPIATRLLQLAAEQGVEPVADFGQLLGDEWPTDEGDESADEFLVPIRELRESSPARSKL
jgi:excisionase family DNA binding protein